MIEYIRGKIAELTPTNVVLETAGGVAYMLNISLPTYTELQTVKDTRVLVHEVIREDAWTLYGFTTARERELFRALIGVSGVGAGTAIIILSAMSVTDLEKVISSGDDKTLKKIKGIGGKTAQRIIVDLKDKISISGDIDQSDHLSNNDAYDEALAALLMLGFQKQAVQKVLKKLFDADPTIKVEAAIKRALAML